MAKASSKLTVKDRKNIVEIINEKRNDPITLDDIFFMPSLGNKFTFINDGMAKASWVKSKGHEILSIATSDKRVTVTAGSTGNTYDPAAGTTRKGKALVIKSDIISTFRHGGKNFHNPDLPALLKELTSAVRSELDKYRKRPEMKELVAEYRRKMNEYIRYGTAFKVDFMVTLNKANGRLCYWKNWLTEDGYKMVLTQFRTDALSRVWIPFTNPLEQSFIKAAGKMNVDYCSSVQKTAGRGCAMKFTDK